MHGGPRARPAAALGRRRFASFPRTHACLGPFSDRPKSDGRRPTTTDDRRPTTRDRRPTDLRPTDRSTDDRRPMTDDRRPTHRRPPTDQPTTDDFDDRRPTSDERPIVRRPTIEDGRPTTDRPIAPRPIDHTAGTDRPTDRPATTTDDHRRPTTNPTDGRRPTDGPTDHGWGVAGKILEDRGAPKILEAGGKPGRSSGRRGGAGRVPGGPRTGRGGRAQPLISIIKGGCSPGRSPPKPMEFNTFLMLFGRGAPRSPPGAPPEPPPEPPLEPPFKAPPERPGRTQPPQPSPPSPPSAPPSSPSASFSASARPSALHLPAPRHTVYRVTTLRTCPRRHRGGARDRARPACVTRARAGVPEPQHFLRREHRHGEVPLHLLSGFESHQVGAGYPLRPEGSCGPDHVLALQPPADLLHCPPRHALLGRVGGVGCLSPRARAVQVGQPPRRVRTAFLAGVPSTDRPTTDGRRPTTNRPTDDRRPTTDNRQPTDDRRPTTERGRPTTDDIRRTTDDRRPTADDRRPTTDDRRPTTDD